MYTNNFVKRAKHFKKKHPSLPEDLAQLEKDLLENPKQGIDLGGGLYKIRLAIKSKGKGKSGGYRIISYIVTNNISSTTINLIYIYDKSEEVSISKQDILQLLNTIF
ncbi:type II toxin-antitoxin system RelE/ParE family toxin [Mucilaginibacter terrae]|uniref:type II toxin-antitoxin system RelE/ParE family toxin n=1 Tax=Mucilaginibacter terrae TaxID=1955052 RepID=UPI00363F6E94